MVKEKRTKKESSKKSDVKESTSPRAEKKMKREDSALPEIDVKGKPIRLAPGGSVHFECVECRGTSELSGLSYLLILKSIQFFLHHPSSFLISKMSQRSLRNGKLYVLLEERKLKLRLKKNPTCSTTLLKFSA